MSEPSNTSDHVRRDTRQTSHHGACILRISSSTRARHLGKSLAPYTAPAAPAPLARRGRIAVRLRARHRQLGRSAVCHPLARASPHARYTRVSPYSHACAALVCRCAGWSLSRCAPTSGELGANFSVHCMPVFNPAVITGLGRVLTLCVYVCVCGIAHADGTPTVGLGPRRATLTHKPTHDDTTLHYKERRHQRRQRGRRRRERAGESGELN